MKTLQEKSKKDERSIEILLVAVISKGVMPLPPYLERIV
jgi:hypothetical protein